MFGANKSGKRWKLVLAEYYGEIEPWKNSRAIEIDDAEICQRLLLLIFSVLKGSGRVI
jgi:hypothetical protein